MLGYAYLTQVKTKEAKKAFEKAIELDQADPLPRLGQGLAKIREGDLADGRRDLEIAAGLDPNNSMIRSYLGKAYFEEKNGKAGRTRICRAKELDPNDPTPWFYDAIASRPSTGRWRPCRTCRRPWNSTTTGRSTAPNCCSIRTWPPAVPVWRESTATWDSSSVALVEGYNSVNTDPSNYSAHRFLADSYSVLPRHEIARVSELLQSQLLQPSNMTPIQPGLAESNLFLISSGGRKLHPLTSSTRCSIGTATLQASGIVGENDTWGGEGVVSGIYDNCQ